MKKSASAGSHYMIVITDDLKIPLFYYVMLDFFNFVVKAAQLSFLSNLGYV